MALKYRHFHNMFISCFLFHDKSLKYYSNTVLFQQQYPSKLKYKDFTYNLKCISYCSFLNYCFKEINNVTGFNENKMHTQDICYEVFKRHKGLSALKCLAELTLWHLFT